MTGQKGRSGRAYTAEAKAAKAAAGRKRWGNVHPGDIAPGPPGHGPTSMDDPMETIADHDRQIGRPVTWPDALKRLQMIEQSIINEKREVELDEARDKRDLARGKLLTVDQHRAAVMSVVEHILASVPILTDAALAQHPPEQHPTVRHALTKAEAAFRLAAMAAIKTG